MHLLSDISDLIFTYCVEPTWCVPKWAEHKTIKLVGCSAWNPRAGKYIIKNYAQIPGAHLVTLTTNPNPCVIKFLQANQGLIQMGYILQNPTTEPEHIKWINDLCEAHRTKNPISTDLMGTWRNNLCSGEIAQIDFIRKYLHEFIDSKITYEYKLAKIPDKEIQLKLSKYLCTRFSLSGSSYTALISSNPTALDIIEMYGPDNYAIGLNPSPLIINILDHMIRKTPLNPEALKYPKILAQLSNPSNWSTIIDNKSELVEPLLSLVQYSEITPYDHWVRIDDKYVKRTSKEMFDHINSEQSIDKLIELAYSNPWVFSRNIPGAKLIRTVRKNINQMVNNS